MCNVKFEASVSVRVLFVGEVCGVVAWSPLVSGVCEVLFTDQLQVLHRQERSKGGGNKKNAV